MFHDIVGVLGYSVWQPLRRCMSVWPTARLCALLHVCMPHMHVCICDSVYKCATFSVIPMPREKQGRGRIKVKDNCHWSIYLMVWKRPIRAVCTHSWLLSYRTAWCSAWIKVPCVEGTVSFTERPFGIWPLLFMPCLSWGREPGLHAAGEGRHHCYHILSWPVRTLSIQNHEALHLVIVFLSFMHMSWR